MKYSPLGSSGLSVSRVCLGSMTWGVQNNQSDADAQIQYAIDNGVNFIDTAEMYPVPPSEQTHGDTEAIIGDWLSRNASKRSDIIIASKIAGPGFPYVRDNSMISGATIQQALDDSLQRLQTDYIDVYQLHWPNRISPHFGKHWPNQVLATEQDVRAERDRMRDIVQGLGLAIQAGKIKHWGLSDDTPWGIHTYLQLCDELGVPKPVSIQNEFNLLHVKDWPYLIESCVFEDIAYLPWSPLSGGMLSGKYIGGARPKGSRWTMMQRNGLFRNTQHAEDAVVAYCEIAKKHGISPSQLALAWCDQVDGVTSTIIGATNLPQLEENIAAFDMTLSQDCVDAVLETLQKYSMPF
ncbi:aldo/keto reductase [Glaciecola sp. MH2013]|uniref:aldo/keto reductase n=1 Tax=Glaciecola sp. MH2013 TaxID=2785524 RepID=UPI00189F109C|nr:aldo/keto reductase [Glaciecola sp. MH2013]MBF7071954.1 aldo/keto reductase [Glaciecola sp. MH2013]